MRESPLEKPKKKKKVPPVPLAKALEKVHGGISQLNRSLVPASTTVLEMIRGGWLSQAIYVAAELEIADHLKFGPKSVEELADRTNTHEPSLYRLLRMLAGHGVFQENKDGQFSQTHLSDSLRADHPNTVRGMALYQGGFHWKHWEKLLYSVRTGNPSSGDIEESSFFEFLKKKPEFGKIFNKAMTEVSTLSQASIAKSFDFSPFKKIIDLDSSSIFSEIPKGGDCYFLKQIIHHWSDDKVLKLLENICRVISNSGRLILVEAIVPEGNTSHLSKDTDLEMLISSGGKERTRDEYSGLLAEAGFRLQETIATATPLSVLVATKI